MVGGIVAVLGTLLKVLLLVLVAIAVWIPAHLIWRYVVGSWRWERNDEER